MFKVSPSSFQTFIDTLNCVFEDRVWYRTVHIPNVCGVSKKIGEWYHKTNKTEDTNKLTLLAFKIIAILHNTLLATCIKLPPYSHDLAPAGARSGEYGGWTSFCFPARRAKRKAHVLQTWRQTKNVWQRFCDRFLKRLLLTVSKSFMNVVNSVLWRMAITLKSN
jgi:hypothetical protein